MYGVADPRWVPAVVTSYRLPVVTIGLFHRFHNAPTCDEPTDGQNWSSKRRRYALSALAANKKWPGSIDNAWRWVDCGRQGSEWHKYRTEFGKKLASQTEVSRLVGPINEVTDDFISKLRHVRDNDGELAVVNNFTKEAHNWSMEGQ